MVDLLLDGGADIDAATQFWANGFWLEKIPVVVSRHLIKKVLSLLYMRLQPSDLLILYLTYSSKITLW
jgi:hypothetical protein